MMQAVALRAGALALCAAFVLAPSASAQSAAVKQKQAELDAPETYAYWNDQVVQHCARDPLPVQFDFSTFSEEQLLSRTRLPEDACKQVIAATGALCQSNEFFRESAQNVTSLTCRNGDDFALSFDADSGVLTYTFSDEQPGSTHYTPIRDWLASNM